MPVFGLARRVLTGRGEASSGVSATAFALLVVSFLEGCASTPVTIAPKASFNAAMARVGQFSVSQDQTMRMLRFAMSMPEDALQRRFLLIRMDHEVGSRD